MADIERMCAAGQMKGVRCEECTCQDIEANTENAPFPCGREGSTNGTYINIDRAFGESTLVLHIPKHIYEAQKKLCDDFAEGYGALIVTRDITEADLCHERGFCDGGLLKASEGLKQNTAPVLKEPTNENKVPFYERFIKK